MWCYLSVPSAHYFNYYVNFSPLWRWRQMVSQKSEELVLDIIQLEATQNTYQLCKKTRRRCGKVRLGLWCYLFFWQRQILYKTSFIKSLYFRLTFQSPRTDRWFLGSQPWTLVRIVVLALRINCCKNKIKRQKSQRLTTYILCSREQFSEDCWKQLWDCDCYA